MLPGAQGKFARPDGNAKIGLEQRRAEMLAAGYIPRESLFGTLWIEPYAPVGTQDESVSTAA